MAIYCQANRFAEISRAWSRISFVSTLMIFGVYKAMIIAKKIKFVRNPKKH